MFGRTDNQPDDSASWGETVRAWRGPLRVVTALAVVLTLVVILVRTLDERAGGAAEAYLGGIFFAVIAVGMGAAVAILMSN
jgi:hypothetical protein